MRFDDAAQITATQGHRSIGDADGVWLELPTGPVWMAPDAARALASGLTYAATECERIRGGGRYGTCVDCPRDANGAHPERCINTARYDHNLRAGR